VLLILWLSFIGLFPWLAWRLDELRTRTRICLGVIGAVLVAFTIWPVVSDPGIVKEMVGTFGLTPLRWIQSPQLAMLCVVIPLVWASSGPGCIIYLAALKGVSDDLYEAAEIDGAGFWHKVVYIVLPRMKFLIVIQFIAAVIGAFKGGTDFILALTGGGPNGSTTILALEIFFRSFLGLDFGIGTAMAWILGALLIGFTAWQLKMLSNAEFSGGR
jgi:multiple sugar transport system permease protein